MLSKMIRYVPAALLAFCVTTAAADDFTAAVPLKGEVTDAAGNPLAGIIVTAIDNDHELLTSVYTDEEGQYRLPPLPAPPNEIRARWIGFEDQILEDVKEALTQGEDYNHKFIMEPVAGQDLQDQRTADSLLGMMEFDNEEQMKNFRMMCTYCHQVGTIGFRTPEEPVDWEVMVTRMDGFAGLHPETKETLVDKLLATYSPEAQENWPDYEPPAPAQGEARDAVIKQWWMGPEDNAMMHDIELGNDGLVYVVDMINDVLVTLDPETGERVEYPVPGGKTPYTDDVPVLGPHSVEKTENGDMWMTLALAGKMAKFDPKTKETTVYWSGENHRRGFYPHSLRVDQDGIVWYTDAAMNSVFRLDPEKVMSIEEAEAAKEAGEEIADTGIKRYELLRLDAVPRANVRGEGGAIVPYGIDIAPDGRVWYSKLNGQRIGVIDPKTDEITEWQPPVHGPRRLHVAPNGIVWVPGYGTGDLASFNPETEEWKVYPLPGDGNALPYALNIEPKSGMVWVCGTGKDTMMRFNPETEELTVYPMPNRVTYTREIEFDEEGNVWTANSNYPVRHVEGHRGSVIMIDPDGQNELKAIAQN